MKLRLTRGEFKQLSGPVTGQRYVFVKMVGQAPVQEVDERDAQAMLALKDGCCGQSYPMFQRAE